MAAPPDEERVADFEVHLENFTGPFDLLLSLIAKHRLDITEVALGQVTDEFIAYVRIGSEHSDWDLETTSSFLVVAATLLELKAARLLPGEAVLDEDDYALLEARDLLFARLLQYRAYRQLSDAFAARLAEQARSVPRETSLEPQFAAVLPELVWRLTPQDLATMAALALAPKPEPPGIPVGHLHAVPVSVAEQAQILAGRVRRRGALTFRALVSDAGATIVVVARFLALLDLFRQGVVGFEQVSALGELTVRWTGPETEEGAA